MSKYQWFFMKGLVVLMAVAILSLFGFPTVGLLVLTVIAFKLLRDFTDVCKERDKLRDILHDDYDYESSKLRELAEECNTS